MATLFESGLASARPALRADGLMRADRSIGGPWFDATLLWSAPALALLLTFSWFAFAGSLPEPAAESAVATLAISVAILTYAHLIAVAPRVYLNREVFNRFRRRFVLVPVMLVGGDDRLAGLADNRHRPGRILGRASLRDADVRPRPQLRHEGGQRSPGAAPRRYDPERSALYRPDSSGRCAPNRSDALPPPVILR